MLWKTIWQYEVAPVLVLILLCLTLFLLPSCHRPLWDPDEGMHAQISREILTTGDWVTPRFNGEKFFDKPILYFWVVSLSFYLLGMNEFAARLPAVLFGLGGVLIVYYLGRRLYGRGVGLLAGIILATTGIYFVLSQNVVHDIALNFFISLALFSFYGLYQRGWTSIPYHLLLYLAMGGAVLAKGPLGVIIPGLIILMFLFSRGRLLQIGRLFSVKGVLLFLAICLPWYLLVTLRNPEFFRDFFIRQNLGRFFSPSTRDVQPFYYYLPELALCFFPWTYYLPNALLARVRSLFRERDKDPSADLFILSWILVVFLFFSLAKAKKWTYLLPIYPGLALLLAKFWEGYLSTAGPSENGQAKGVRLSSWLLLVSYLPAPLFLAFYVRWHPLPLLPQSLLIEMVVVSVFSLILLGVIHIYFLLRDLRWGLFLINLLFIGVNVLLFVHYGFPLISENRSLKGLAIRLDRLLPPGERLVFYDHLWESALFYSGRKAQTLENIGELKRYLASKRQVYCLIRQKDYNRYRDYLEGHSQIIDRQGQVLLIGNLPN